MGDLHGIDGDLVESQQQRQALQSSILPYEFHQRTPPKIARATVARPTSISKMQNRFVVEKDIKCIVELCFRSKVRGEATPHDSPHT